MQNRKIDYAEFEQVYALRKTEKISKSRKIRLITMCVRLSANVILGQANTKFGGNMNIRNEIKSYIVREGLTLSEVVEKLVEEHGWNESCFCFRVHFASVPNWILVLADKSPRSSRSVPNFSGKLQRGSLRYSEAKELANVLGYELVWQKRGKR